MIALNGIKLWDVKWSATTAGPSPYNNERTEMFFLGCRRAMEGNPCNGCFNTATHDDTISTVTYDPVKAADHTMKYAPNKYITIGGGEPTDQMENLILLCKRLKEKGAHIMVYTWRELTRELRNQGSDHADGPMGDQFRELLKHIDILVDGEYMKDERLYNDGKQNDGTFNSVGSGNQIIWDARTFNDPTHKHYHKKLEGYALRHVKSVSVKEEGDILCYDLAPGAKKTHAIV